jgi:hypothetical protein
MDYNKLSDKQKDTLQDIAVDILNGKNPKWRGYHKGTIAVLLNKQFIFDSPDGYSLTNEIWDLPNICALAIVKVAEKWTMDILLRNLEYNVKGTMDKVSAMFPSYDLDWEVSTFRGVEIKIRCRVSRYDSFDINGKLVDNNWKVTLYFPSASKEVSEMMVYFNHAQTMILITREIEKFLV